MSEQADSPLKVVAQAIQDSMNDDPGLPEGTLCLGWVAVTEWITPEGKRGLSKMSSDINGKPLSSWNAQGYLFNALHAREEWPDGSPDVD